MTEVEKQRLMLNADDPVALFIATGGERMLRYVVWAILATIALVNIVQYAQYGQVTAPTAFFPFLAVVIGTWWLLKRQRFHAAFTLFLWGLVLAGISTGFIVAGFQSPGLFFAPIGMMLAAWLLRRRQVGAMLLVTIVGYLMIALLQSQGKLPSATRSPLFWATTFSAVSVICTLVGLSMTAGIRSQYRRAVSLSEDLADLNQDLEQKVVMRTAELEETLQRLRQTQDDLIQSEKLASLGCMVAGIAHELNTPLGNALTVSTTLAESTKVMLGQFEAGAMKKSDLMQGLVAAHEMAMLIDRSVKRSSALVDSFKQVAVDQISDRRRQFDLHRVIEENLAALRPSLLGKPWVISNHVAEGIACDSFPGPLGQVLTNLIQNAITHGFAGCDCGNIEITAKVADTMLELTVADDGVGMDTATCAHIFDPFFTTKLGQGGSGLGLAICYRIVSTILAGEIRVQSSHGSGTQFLLRIPLRSPGKI